ncbi:hypothetical protein [Haloglycomyces albus]|uniref:hypothetical protein n=1 Tax=Haloglycomyces albus TaxID=526067 RepID=UPI00046D8F7A|nr:hypothetical protein [Haloglycomyces albus]
MGNVLRLDTDEVESASKNLRDLADETTTSASGLISESSNALIDIDIREYQFRAGLIRALDAWYDRAKGFANRIEDASEYVETHVSLAREADENASDSLVELQDAISADDYTTSDYRDATGAESSSDESQTPSGRNGEVRFS